VITLPDSARVVLAPASTLAYDVSNGTSVREVSLVGQAYFDVAHDSEWPFRVRVGNAVLEDLGMEFSVRAYGTDAAMRVAVRRGRVAVRTAQRATLLVLDGGEAACVDTIRGATRSRADPTLDFAWRTGTLAFRGAPVSAIVAELHRWFDVDICIRDDTLLALALTMELRSATPRDAINDLAAVLELHVEQHGRTFILYPR
jgi:transmembrane sensor